MRDLLGGKGAGAAEMTRAGMPVPPGFTITTEACREYYARKGKLPDDLWKQVTSALATLEKQSRKQFGDPRNPLLVSVRSGAKFSMPGMMDTVLNLGLNDETASGLARLAKNERFALDAHRRFIQMFGKTVKGIDGKKFESALTAAKRRAGVKTDPELTAPQLRRLVRRFLSIYKDATRQEFPSDPLVQLREAIEAVFDSWNTPRAVTYRRMERIPDDLGTAVNVQMMAFGNMGATSGTGVAFTRNPITGRKELYGDYLADAQGEDVVAGVRDPEPIRALKRRLPKVYAQFERHARKLEKHYRDVQDLEFTVERGKLFMLQTRAAKRTGEAAVRIAVDMVKERLITTSEAVNRVEPRQLEQLLFPRVDPNAKAHAIARGVTGDLYVGRVPTIEPRPLSKHPSAKAILGWADELRRLQVWANADYPRDAIKARENGAQGVGLCRTEHMFMEEDRLPIVQSMILADSTREREKHLARLLPIQRGDFTGIFKAMAGLPVVIRLIDPPLHEFLPNMDNLIRETTVLKVSRKNPRKLKRLEKVLARVEDLHEANPMLGLRGCRLSILYPEIT